MNHDEEAHTHTGQALAHAVRYEDLLTEYDGTDPDENPDADAIWAAAQAHKDAERAHHTAAWAHTHRHIWAEQASEIAHTATASATDTDPSEDK